MQDQKNLYQIALKDFSVPLWWVEENPDKATWSDFKLEQVFSFEIHDVEHEPSATLARPFHIEVYSIQFTGDNTIFYLATGLTCLGVLAFALVYFCGTYILLPWVRKEKQPRDLPLEHLPYKKLDLPDYKDEELEKIITLIMECYTDPDFSIQTIHDKTGIPLYRITKILKDEMHVSFIQLVNRLRITEAKRLLWESDRQVNDIAFRVGFNSQAYFNKIFRELENTSPKEFRRLHRE